MTSPLTPSALNPDETKRVSEWEARAEHASQRNMPGDFPEFGDWEMRDALVLIRRLEKRVQELDDARETELQRGNLWRDDCAKFERKCDSLSEQLKAAREELWWTKSQHDAATQVAHRFETERDQARAELQAAKERAASDANRALERIKHHNDSKEVALRDRDAAEQRAQAAQQESDARMLAIVAARKVNEELRERAQAAEKERDELRARVERAEVSIDEFRATASRALANQDFALASVQVLREALTDSSALLSAGLLEPRQGAEVDAQVADNRIALDQTAESAKAFVERIRGEALEEAASMFEADFKCTTHTKEEALARGYICADSLKRAARVRALAGKGGG